MRRFSGYAAAAMSLAMMLSIPVPGVVAPAAAAETNWMRERVAQWEGKMAARFLGPEAAARLLAKPRIIGGDQAPPGKWPFQAALVNASVPDNFNAQYCGASVIGERFILTAAHCVDFLTGPAQVQVLTNTQSLASGGTRHDVAKIKFHRRWNPDTSDYDVAIIKIKGKVSGIPAAKRAKFITSVEEESDFAPPRTKAFVTGWGDTDPGSPQDFPTELRQVQVPIVKTKVCNAPDSYDGEITKRMLCAGLAAGGKDSCQGDSGGPFVVKDADGKFRLQVGIVSWGIGCALPDLYGVYSRLAVLGPWVEDMIAALE
jgi:secreted trypsin-like serine protease